MVVFVSVEAAPRIRIPLTPRIAAHRSEAAAETSDAGAGSDVAAVRLAALDERHCCKFMPLTMPTKMKSSSKVRSLRGSSKNSERSDEVAAEWINSAVRDPLVELDPMTMEQFLKDQPRAASSSVRNGGIDPAKVGNSSPVATSRSPFWSVFSTKNYSPPPHEGLGSVVLAMAAAVFVASAAVAGHLVRKHRKGIMAKLRSNDFVSRRGGRLIEELESRARVDPSLSDEERQLDVLSIVDGSESSESDDDGKIGSKGIEELDCAKVLVAAAASTSLRRDLNELEQSEVIRFDQIRQFEASTSSNARDDGKMSNELESIALQRVGEASTSQESKIDAQIDQAQGQKIESAEGKNTMIKEEGIGIEVVVAAAVAATATISKEFQRSISEIKLQELEETDADHQTVDESDEDELTDSIVRDVLADLAALEAMEREKDRVLGRTDPTTRTGPGASSGETKDQTSDFTRSVTITEESDEQAKRVRTDLHSHGRSGSDDTKVDEDEETRRELEPIGISFAALPSNGHHRYHNHDYANPSIDLRDIVKKPNSSSDRNDVEMSRIRSSEANQGEDRARTQIVGAPVESQQLSYDEEIKKIVQAVVPAFAVGAGAMSIITGVDGALEMVGFAAATSFLCYDLLWAKTRKDLWNGFRDIKDHRELLQFLRSKKIVRPDDQD